MSDRPVPQQKSNLTAGRIAALALGVVAAVIILQNSESQSVQLLFWEVTMPLALLLFIMFALGYVAALIAARVAARRQKD